MAIKLANISDWRPLSADRLLILEAGPHGDKVRKVRLEVNCANPTRFHLVREGKPFHFLATVEGLDTIEFYEGGDIRISASCPFGSDQLVEAFYYTADGQKTHTELPDARTFTRLAERPARNPELEMMQFMAEQNMRRLMSRMEAEVERRFAPKPEKKPDGKNGAPAPSGATSKKVGDGAKPKDDPAASGDDGPGSGKPEKAPGDGAGQRSDGDSEPVVPTKS